MPAPAANAILPWVREVVAGDSDVDAWNEAVCDAFGPFVRRKSILRTQRELLRTELINLAKILPFPRYTTALRDLARLYRRNLRKKANPSRSVLRESIQSVGGTSDRWLALFFAREGRPAASSVHDHAYQLFEALEAVLEGCVKPHLRVIHAFCSIQRCGQSPANLTSLSFGNLGAGVEETLGRSGKLLLRDPEYGIPVHQWRNVASHRAFEVVGGDRVRIVWGRNLQNSREVEISGLTRVLHWAVLSFVTCNLAHLVVFLEHVAELGNLEGRVKSIRLESWMVRLSHNLSLVGFEVLDWLISRGVFRCYLRNVLERSNRDALIHASQILDQLATAADSDPARRDDVLRVEVVLQDDRRELLASASIAVSDALAATLGEISMKEQIRLTDFSFVDAEGRDGAAS